MRALGTDSADVAALVVARGLRAGAEAPVALAPVARRLRAEVRVEPLGVDGRLDVDDGRFVIRLREGGSWRRRRWTLAHELAHLAAVRLVARFGGDPADLRDPRSWRALERFCDRTAADLLIDPAEVRARDCDDLDRSSLFDAYDRHLVSWEALLAQVSRVFGAMSASIWSPTASTGRWRLDWQCGGRYLHELPHEIASERLEDDLVDIAWRDGEVRGTLAYTYDGARRSFEALGVALRRPSCRQAPLPGAGGAGPDDDPAPRVAVLLLDPILSGVSRRSSPGVVDPLLEFDERFAPVGRAASRPAVAATPGVALAGSG
jgi:hypothetical protein